jgi:hypothetical protein
MGPLINIPSPTSLNKIIRRLKYCISVPAASNNPEYSIFESPLSILVPSSVVKAIIKKN